MTFSNFQQYFFTFNKQNTKNERFKYERILAEKSPKESVLTEKNLQNISE